MLARPHRALALLLLSWACSGAGLAAENDNNSSNGSNGSNNNCEAIRARIDAKVRASGTKDYAVTVVGAEAKVAGRVVGSCELGTKKIVYTRLTRDNEVITECRDGRVVRGGDCSGNGNR